MTRMDRAGLIQHLNRMDARALPGRYPEAAKDRSMIVTMTEQYGTRIKPTEPVRILCVDESGDWPVVAIVDGIPYRYQLNGRFSPGGETSRDLVPLQAAPRKWLRSIELVDTTQPGRYREVPMIEAAACDALEAALEKVRITNYGANQQQIIADALREYREGL